MITENTDLRAQLAKIADPKACDFSIFWGNIYVWCKLEREAEIAGLIPNTGYYHFRFNANGMEGIETRFKAAVEQVRQKSKLVLST